MKQNYIVGLLIFLAGILLAESASAQVKADVLGNYPAIRKLKDVVIYKDENFFSAFPSVVKQKNGQLLLAFRRAPDRRVFGEKSNSHVDPNSYLVAVCSRDGESWTNDPEILYAHPFGGSQDPCLLTLHDGTLLCASYGWAFVRPDGIPNLREPYLETGGAIFLGGYMLRSVNGGKNWTGPLYPPPVPGERNFNALGKVLPAFNRGALCEGRNGRIYWAVVGTDSVAPRKTSVHLYVSDDKGASWQYSSLIARDDKASFNETSIYETPKGDLVAFLRTAGMGDQACMARSADGGKTFQAWEPMGFHGCPLTALRLPDKRVLLTYGYRHQPYGIRCRVLNAECTDFATAPEFVVRDDGGSWDLGYPWAVQLDKKRVLVVYYYNHDNTTRYIAGSVLEIK
jgi:hypothetical protein